MALPMSTTAPVTQLLSSMYSLSPQLSERTAPLHAMRSMNTHTSNACECLTARRARSTGGRRGDAASRVSLDASKSSETIPPDPVIHDRFLSHAQTRASRAATQKKKSTGLNG